MLGCSGILVCNYVDDCELMVFKWKVRCVFWEVEKDEFEE